jgi:crotonobetainyl-CoA:carnitine CoA-transferase CaiB-like acyl-CoA transferase
VEGAVSEEEKRWSRLPLSGIRVLDLSRLLPGPFCAQLLGDYGADVIKVEDTGPGDFSRLLPPFIGAEGSSAQGAAFLAINRNKRSIALDLKTEGGKEALRRLARGADVLLEGFRPGVLDRLGLGYEALRRENPRLVYCALTGYGQDGPLRDRAGHDLNYLGYAGVLAMTGMRGGPPVPPGIQVADLTGALYAAIGILLALEARARTGVGQLVDVSMLDGALSLLSIHAGAVFAGARLRRGEFMLSGGRPNYAVYETRDGRYLAVGAVEPKFWEAFARALGREDWIARQYVEGEEAAALRAEVAAAIRERTLAEWTALFDGVEACVSPVLEPEEALDGEQVAARGMRRAMPHGALGLIHQIGPAVRLSETPGELRLAPPRQGEHTDEVLAEAGFSAEEIAALRAAGAAR